jgi:3',5'-cyclic AMP phosphodiesterase CpdA
VRIVAHLSDLHFGRTDANMVAALQKALHRLAPNLIVISGDFTQRAAISEFIEARAFLDALPAPYLAVPGNHDIRLYDVYGRFVRPLRRYMQFVCETVEPVYNDPELTVVSVNTARSLTFKGGRINAEQVRRISRHLTEAAPGAIKVLVAHHPLDLPDAITQPLAGRARMAIAALANSGLDMIVSGHLHVSYYPKAVERLRVGGHNALLVQAGTAVSTRSRGQANSFNAIWTAADHIAITQHCWSPEHKEFQPSGTARYRRALSGWVRDEP